jgi:hypothetical protein
MAASFQILSSHDSSSVSFDAVQCSYFRRVGTNVREDLTAGKKDRRNLRSRSFGETWLLGDLHEVETAFEEI